MTEEELEQELAVLKELGRNITLAIKEAMEDCTKFYKYEKAVQEYEDEKNKLYRELQQDRGD